MVSALRSKRGREECTKIKQCYLAAESRLVTETENGMKFGGEAAQEWKSTCGWSLHCIFSCGQGIAKLDFICFVGFWGVCC